MKKIKLLSMLFLIALTFSCTNQDEEFFEKPDTITVELNGKLLVLTRVALKDNILKSNSLSKSNLTINCIYNNLITGTTYTVYTYNGVGYYHQENIDGTCYEALAGGGVQANCRDMHEDGLSLVQQSL